MEADFPKYGLVLIDEIETSLHPRAQHRLIRDLADKCRERELQIILTTHSPYILDELPPEGRAYIIKRSGSPREIVYGVSSEFAMSKMDDLPHTECDLFVEDERAAVMLTEILTAHRPSLVHRCRAVPYGAASVGRALGIMNSQKRWPRPTCVFLDADAEPASGCVNLPGNGAPEIDIFEDAQRHGFTAIATRTGRPYSDVADAMSQAMAIDDHHEWIRFAASKLLLGGDTLWQAMCADWASRLPSEKADVYSVHVRTRKLRTSETPLVSGSTR